MEIRNIYEDSYGDERLYSVLMDEDEVSLFSELQKEFGLVKAANKAAKKAWERKMADPIAKEMGISKYVSTPNGRTVLSDRYKRYAINEARSRNREMSLPNKLSSTPFFPGGDKRSDIRERIGSNLTSKGHFEDYAFGRGVSKSTLRERVAKQIKSGENPLLRFRNLR